MLARRLTTIVPAMTMADSLETTRIHRVTGRTGDRKALGTTRPCRAPHHTLSGAGLIGGGHGSMPGDLSLAHRGVVHRQRPAPRLHHGGPDHPLGGADGTAGDAGVYRDHRR